MSAADRKVVHDTVAELDGLATISEGEDARRHVVIRPRLSPTESTRTADDGESPGDGGP